MPSGSTNFLQWNPNANLQENDATFADDAQRLSGATLPSQFSNSLANKCFYQWSTFITAFCNMLAGKNYSPNDGSSSPSTALANLVGVLNNVLTFFDLPTIFTSPSFTGIPTAPTAAVGTNTTQLATMAALLQGTLRAETSGYRIQQGIGTGTSVTFPTAFSAPPVFVPVGVGGSVNIGSVSATGATVNTTVSTFHWIAIGPS